MKIEAWCEECKKWVGVGNSTDCFHVVTDAEYDSYEDKWYPVPAQCGLLTKWRYTLEAER